MGAQKNRLIEAVLLSNHNNFLMIDKKNPQKVFLNALSYPGASELINEVVYIFVLISLFVW